MFEHDTTSPCFGHKLIHGHTRNLLETAGDIGRLPSGPPFTRRIHQQMD